MGFHYMYPGDITISVVDMNIAMVTVHRLCIAITSTGMKQRVHECVCGGGGFIPVILLFH